MTKPLPASARIHSVEREVSVDLGHGLANNTNAVTWATEEKQDTLRATHCANEMFASHAEGYLGGFCDGGKNSEAQRAFIDLVVRVRAAVQNRERGQGMAVVRALETPPSSTKPRRSSGRRLARSRDRFASTWTGEFTYAEMSPETFRTTASRKHENTYH